MPFRQFVVYLHTINENRDTLNAIDLIVCLVLVLAVWNGWRQGFIVQICSLAGLVAAIWVAARYGAWVGELLRLDESVSAAGGFVAVLVVVVILVAIGARALRKVCRFAGLGLADIILGVAVAALKYLLLLGALFMAFDKLNEDYSIVGPQTIEKSKSYRPVMRLSESALPFLDWISEQVPEQKPGKE